jgi:Skp family chaperone for outer membrane proteins
MKRLSFLVSITLILLTGLSLTPKPLLAQTVSERKTVEPMKIKIQEDLRGEVQRVKEELRQDLKEKRESFRKEIQNKQQELRQKVEARQKVLKEELSKIKDERRRIAVEKIDRQLGELNERLVNHFADTLDRLEEALSRISARTDLAEKQGLKTAEVRVAINKALASIEASRSAIKLQAGKTYTLTITGDDNLRVQVDKARLALKDDLAKVRQTLIAAKEAVRQAGASLAQILGVREGNNLPAGSEPSNNQ